jgi:hypothetical protein
MNLLRKDIKYRLRASAPSRELLFLQTHAASPAAHCHRRYALDCIVTLAKGLSG